VRTITKKKKHSVQTITKITLCEYVPKNEIYNMAWRLVNFHAFSITISGILRGIIVNQNCSGYSFLKQIQNTYYYYINTLLFNDTIISLKQ